MRCLLGFCLYLLALLSPLAVQAETYRIAVLYPASSDKVAALYRKIIDGMQHPALTLLPREIAAEPDLAALNLWLREQRAELVVLLGKAGLELSKQLQLDIPLLTGAHSGAPPDHSAVSLSADPAQLFAQLKRLKPGIREVLVIYSANYSGWLMEHAQRAAAAHGLVLQAETSQSVLQSGQKLKAMIDRVDTGKQAIWLLYDPLVPVKPLLPDLLKSAWNKNLVIFSGNPFHVQQGTLFALFPDYARLGKQLIDQALRQLRNREIVDQQASIYLNRAINLRTASHLGIQLSRNQREDYQMVFPRGR